MKFDLKIKPFADFCRENKKTVFLIFAVAVIIAALSFAGSFRDQSFYIRDKSGKITGLNFGETDRGQSLPITVEAVKDGVKIQMDLFLALLEDEEESPLPSGNDDPKQALHSAVRDIVRQIESQEKGTVDLPEKLSDGTRFSWSRPKGASPFAVIFLAPVFLLLLYQNSREKEKNAAKRKAEEIKRQLPAFNNQLLLLLGSGLIFNDAFMRISDGYESRPSMGYLDQLVRETAKETVETGSSLVTVLNRKSKEIGVREFSRLTGVITENQFKGVNLTEKLESESEILWTQRKKLAEERGRAAETKLSFPLALLLLVLILITAAPAILQM